MAAEVDFGDRELFGQLEGEPGPPSPPALEEPDPLLQLYERLRDRDETVQRLRAENILAGAAGPAAGRGKAGAPPLPVPFRASRSRPSGGSGCSPGSVGANPRSLPGPRGERAELGGEGAPGAPRLPQSTFSLHRNFYPQSGRARPGMRGWLLKRLSLNPCIPPFKSAINNYKELNCDKFPKGFLGLPLQQSGI